MKTATTHGLKKGFARHIKKELPNQLYCGKREVKLELSRLKVFFVLTVVLVLAITPIQVWAVKPESKLLKGAYRIDTNGWYYVHLEGNPYQIGYQHGYLLADNIQESWNACIHVYWSENSFGDWWYAAREISELYIWPKVPDEMRQEMQGIADGVQAKGYEWDVLDIVAFNAWADIDAYWNVWEESQKKSVSISLSHIEKGCSAFIATGSYTSDGGIVIGHNTWAGYAGDGYWNVIFDVKPNSGHRIVYQSTGGCIWSGQDWIYNDAGLMVCETTLPGMGTYNVNGIPVFVRIRNAMQYGSSIDEFIGTMTYKSNGAYSNEWLIGDAKSGEICSLQLGCYAWDIERTYNGFIGSCNYPKGPNVRSETTFNWHTPWTSSYCRNARWNELKAYCAANPGLIDCSVGMEFLSDHKDTWTGAFEASSRTLCGHCEAETNVRPGDLPDPSGAYDGKVTCSALVQSEMGMWGRWGHPCGTQFDASVFLILHPEYSWQLPYLHDIPLESVPWTYFTKDMKP